MQLMHNKTL